MRQICGLWYEGVIGQKKEGEEEVWGGQIPVSCQPLWQHQPVDWFTQPAWRLAISNCQSPPSRTINI